MSRHVLLLILLAAVPAVADDDGPKEVNGSVHFLCHEEIIHAIVETEPFIAWVKPMFPAIEDQFADETKVRTIVLQVTLHPDRPAEAVVAGRPALSDAEARAVLKEVDLAKAPRSRAVDCSFRFVIKVNGGDPDEDGPLTPPIQTPDDVRRERFRDATTAEQLDLMKRWARTEAIPLLAAFAEQADPKFVGVRNFGKALGAVKPEGPLDVSALTDRNSDYWRAMMEMDARNPAVPAARVALHAAEGKIGLARRFAEAVAPFDGRDSGPSHILGELGGMMNLFLQDVDSRIKQGIALNDKGEFDEALKVFEGVLKDYPHSAWALYEQFHTTRMKGLNAKADPQKLHEGWPEVRRAILEADPLYSSMASATGPEQAYDLFLRKETEFLFKDRDKFAPDLVRYAEIALDLGQPGFAGLLYWNTFGRIKPENYGNREIIEDFLYCLEQLGVKDLKSNFKGDHAAEFDRIAAERETRKRESTAFKSFKDPK